MTLPVAVNAAEQNTTSENSETAQAQETEQKEIAEPAETSAESESSADQPADEVSTPKSEVERWQERVETLLEEIDKGLKTSEEANQLYEELSQQLRLKRKVLDDVLRWAESPTTEVEAASQPVEGEDVVVGEERSVTVEDVYNSMVGLYETRILLLQAVTPDLKTQITGHGEAGQTKFKGEMEYMMLYLRFHAMAIPQLWPLLLDQLVATPVLIIFDLLKLVLAIVLFRWWRQWAPQGLVDLRGRIMRIRPRTQHSLRLARLVWYLQEIRAPLEWMILLGVLIKLVSTPSLIVIEDFLHIVFNALLFAWLAVRLINAIASRGVAGLADDTSGLRLRSLRLVAAWILVLSLGLKLTETYTGEGTIYAMVWTLFQALSVPVVILLLSWWRLEVKQSLEKVPALPGWIANITQNQGFPRRYLSTLFGALYLTHIALRQFGIRQLSRFVSGRVFVVNLISRELYQHQERKALALNTRPLDNELSDQLLVVEGEISKKVYGKELKRLTEFIGFGDGGMVSIRGERGIGKSQLLKDLAHNFDENCIIVKCSTQGFDGVVRDLAAKFSTQADLLNPALFADLVESHGIRFIAFDDVHLLARPKMNGVVELDRLSGFVEPLRSRVKAALLITMNRSAYQYLRRLRGERAVLMDSLELPAWTLEQITELIEIRSQEVGIEADFSEIEIPYQYDDIEFESLDERNRSWFYRILWSMSAGNPSVALRLWKDSLAQTPDGRVIVQVLPQVFAVDSMDGVNMPILLMLRVIVQSGMTTSEEIAESLQLPSIVVENGIRYALHSGWIEESDGYYQITWRWFRTVKQVLTRQNLLAR